MFLSFFSDLFFFFSLMQCNYKWSATHIHAHIYSDDILFGLWFAILDELRDYMC